MEKICGNCKYYKERSKNQGLCICKIPMWVYELNQQVTEDKDLLESFITVYSHYPSNDCECFENKE